MSASGQRASPPRTGLRRGRCGWRTLSTRFSAGRPMPQGDLSSVLLRSNREFIELNDTFTALVATYPMARPGPRVGNGRAAIEGCVVALVDVWSRFCRDV